MRRLTNKKGSATFIEEVGKIVFAVIGIFLLLLLAGKLWGLQKKTDIDKAKATLDKIISSAYSIENENIIRQEIIESPNKWVFVSLEKPAQGLCNGYCLCLCKESDCSGENFACKLTGERFILLKQKNGIGAWALNEDMPFSAQLKYKPNQIYILNIEDSPPVFFRFNEFQEGKWEFSSDLENWMNLDDTRATENLFAFIEDFNREILNIDYGDVEEQENKKEILNEKGIEFLNNRNVKESEGVIVFQVI